MQDHKSLLETKSKDIDGFKIDVVVFTAIRGLQIKGRLIKFIGPAIGKAAKGIGSIKGKLILDIDLDIGVLGEAIAGLAEHLDDPKIIELILDLLTSTRIDGQGATKPLLDITFAAKYISLYKILFFVIEANCFFGNGSIGDIFETANIPTKTRKSTRG